MAVIKVPKTPKTAFDPNRPPSGLIQAQIQHLEAAAGIYPGTAARRAKLRTEGESAEYIAQLTARIYEQAGTERGPEVPVPQPAPPIAGTPTPTSSTRHVSGAAPPSARKTAKRTGRSTSASKAKRRPASTSTRRAVPAAKRRTPSTPKRRPATGKKSARSRGGRG
jgi:hypothetical protein